MIKTVKFRHTTHPAHFYRKEQDCLSAMRRNFFFARHFLAPRCVGAAQSGPRCLGKQQSARSGGLFTPGPHALHIHLYSSIPPVHTRINRALLGLRWNRYTEAILAEGMMPAQTLKHSATALFQPSYRDVKLLARLIVDVALSRRFLRAFTAPKERLSATIKRLITHLTNC